MDETTKTKKLSTKDWIVSNFENHRSNNVGEFYELYLQDNAVEKHVTKKYFKETLMKYISELAEKMQPELELEVDKLEQSNYETEDDSIIEQYEIELLKKEKTIQKLRDTNTALRRTSRNAIRDTNMVDTMVQSLLDNLPTVNFPVVDKKVISKNKANKKRWGILTLSDIHANTKVMPNEANKNCYNIDIMAKRLDMYITKAIEHFINVDVTDVYIMLCGDAISSVSRDNEKLVQITSMTNAAYILTNMIVQIVTRLCVNGFKVNLTGIVGNESRIPKDFDINYLSATENFDWIILLMLKQILINKVPVDIPINPTTNIVSLTLDNNQNFNVLINHGYHTKCSEGGDIVIRNSVASICPKIDLALYGHYHHYCNFNNKSVFNGSLMGSNSYSTSLGYITRASQSISVINSADDFYTIPIDVQDGYEAYEGLYYDSVLAEEATLQHEWGFGSRGPEVILR